MLESGRLNMVRQSLELMGQDTGDIPRIEHIGTVDPSTLVGTACGHACERFLTYPYYGESLATVLAGNVVSLRDILIGFLDVLRTVQKLAFCGVAHTNLRLSNIVMNDAGHMMLIDYGSTVMENPPDGFISFAFLTGARPGSSRMPPEARLAIETFKTLRRSSWGASVTDPPPAPLEWLKVAPVEALLADHVSDVCQDAWYDTRRKAAFEAGGIANPVAGPPHDSFTVGSVEDRVATQFALAQSCVMSARTAEIVKAALGTTLACCNFTGQVGFSKWTVVQARIGMLSSHAYEKPALAQSLTNLYLGTHCPPMPCRFDTIDVYGAGCVLLDILRARTADFDAYPLEVRRGLLHLVAVTATVFHDERATATEAHDKLAYVLAQMADHGIL